MNKTSTQNEILMPNPKNRVWKLGVFFAAILSLAWVGFTVFPDIIGGALGYQEYLRPGWAHEPQTLEVLLRFCLAVWLLLTVTFFSLWLMHRSIRLLQGKSWRVYFRDKHKHFFPNILVYLKLSCFFLTLVWLYVVAQYPIQFLN